uniref:DNA replication licensing factor MCM7 n=1 Tax=Corethron hystrix TaxID=216773 RepID=A0A7S1BLQ2_9STRA
MTPMLLAEEDELYRMKATEPLSLRDIRSHAIGSLVTVRAIVTRTSDVRPRCSVATYTCDACGHEVYQVVRGSEFLPATTCPVCVTNDNPNRAKNLLHLQIRGSALVKHQEARVQEMPGQVPTGHVPRTLTVHLVGEMARTCVPGDVVRISGIYLPKRAPVKFGRGGSMHLGLVATAYLEATAVHVEKKGYEDMLVSVSDAAASGVSRVAHGMDPVGRLARSLAPEIYGHEDVKRSMLLQLVGGSSRKLKDGMKIRGDINILLMGDPGVAKSQLLKYVAGAAPRGVYTTGRGSSGVGLTAAVTRDANTGDLSLEGGALVLADMGVCCIDEFDKMEDTDRTAIHEVMEQQTVSIAKAGITATLNARAAVLAAANPLYGRYNRHKSLSENINLPNSLLSRFDLLFLLLDVPDADHDVALARHVTYVHKTGKTVRETEDVGQKRKRPSARLFDEDGSDDTDSEEEEAPLDAQIIREYIRRARMHHPTVPVDVAPYIVEAYVGLRMQNHNVGPVPIPAQQRGRKETYGRPASAPAHDQTVMTARQLLSILRLGQALARLRFSNYVAKEDVDEAIRITHMSRASLHDHVGKDGRRKEDVPSRIFGVLKEHMNSSGRNRLEMAVCEAMVLRKGFTAEQLKKCLAEYEELDILSVNGAGTQVDFLV